ncbi:MULTISPECIES: Lrp/AsnC family transcriptional regulator [Rhizobium/Agrobacterium group]|uniref:Lrp/AsnC family transcriptional regulator n=1 Tax=Rhizobium/Agrobacterium group TaxID=227290 RepID=UPI00107F16F3|nr:MULTISPECIES: Lrp/AsnC family transcriptional regulator [Rhizobium/Agrobacterium group]MBB4403150.1 Lrp/AsnC family transcriptional regulator [Agrobacterium radiobacter]MBB5588940.1 Lrp/AsnC family transcriptional regulator [Agrobacterium radiobacter]TGE86532.1 AsnC family transcriptional regulator [Rhizobium sp. SEMIA 4032]
MKKITLDSVDRAILRAVQQQGDISQAQLAEKVGASAASCWRRITKLEEAGVLTKTVRLVDADAIDKGLNVFCQVRMKSHDPGARRDFERFIHSHQEVLECYSMSGEWDYLIRAVVGDVREYEALLMKGILTHDAVLTSSSHFALKAVKYTTALPV